MHWSKNIIGWLLAITIWGSGAVILRTLWLYQKTLPDPTASFIELTVMFISTFYILALFPIKDTVDRVCFGFCELPDPILES